MLDDVGTDGILGLGMLDNDAELDWAPNWTCLFLVQGIRVFNPERALLGMLVDDVELDWAPKWTFGNWEINWVFGWALVEGLICDVAFLIFIVFGCDEPAIF